MSQIEPWSIRISEKATGIARCTNNILFGAIVTIYGMIIRSIGVIQKNCNTLWLKTRLIKYGITIR